MQQQQGSEGGAATAATTRSRPVLNLMAIENCLCEGNKYLRTHYGKGRFKQKYSGTTGSDQRYRTDYTAMLRLLDASWGAANAPDDQPSGASWALFSRTSGRVSRLSLLLLRVRVQIIRHARTHSVGKYQSCMF